MTGAVLFFRYLLASQDVVPDAGAAEVDVKVGVRPSLAHETVVLDLRRQKSATVA